MRAEESSCALYMVEKINENIFLYLYRMFIAALFIIHQKLETINMSFSK